MTDIWISGIFHPLDASQGGNNHFEKGGKLQPCGQVKDNDFEREKRSFFSVINQVNPLSVRLFVN